MAFTTGCMIRLSQPWIWRRLGELGYKHNPFYGMPMVFNGITIANDGYYHVMRPAELTLEPAIIDCGMDPDLFFALAALRDDGDRAQWFIVDERCTDNPNPKFFWMRCSTDDIADDVPAELLPYCIKATSPEIVDYFLTPSEDRDAPVV